MEFELGMVKERKGAESTSLATAKSRQQEKKVEVYHEVLRRLKEVDHSEAQEMGFDDHLWAHFNRLPPRSYIFYAEFFSLDLYLDLDLDVRLFSRFYSSLLINYLFIDVLLALHVPPHPLILLILHCNLQVCHGCQLREGRRCSHSQETAASRCQS